MILMIELLMLVELTKVRARVKWESLHCICGFDTILPRCQHCRKDNVESYILKQFDLDSLRLSAFSLVQQPLHGHCRRPFFYQILGQSVSTYNCLAW